MARTGRVKEGKPISEKPEDKAWKQWFEKLTLEDHDKKLSELGLDDEDIKEFNEKVKEGKGKKDRI